MHRLIEFLSKIYLTLLFLALEGGAIYFYATSSSFTQARILAQASSLLGGVDGSLSSASQYFDLKQQNDLLLSRIAQLESDLANKSGITPGDSILEFNPIDTLQGSEPLQYHYTTARVVSNTINRRNNFIVINRGAADSVKINTAVLTPQGQMVGYVVETTDNYSAVISILNSEFRTSGKIANSSYFGSLRWSGARTDQIILEELSKYAEPEVGDTIVSTGFSQYFPSNVVVGLVSNAELNEEQTSYSVTVDLAAEISALDIVILVENRDFNTIHQLVQGAQQK